LERRGFIFLKRKEERIMFKDKRKAVVGILGVALFLLLLTLTAPGAAWVADMMFLKIDGIPGESRDAKHKEWIDIRTWDWSQSGPGSGAASQGGRASQRPVFQNVKVTMQTGKHSPKLLRANAEGFHFKEVRLEVMRDNQVNWLEIKLNDCVISSYDQVWSAQGFMDKTSINFGKVVFTYIEQKRPGGSGGGKVDGGWVLK
jgi:type VI secretion system secreted protein Hcp